MCADANDLIRDFELDVATPECSPLTTAWRATVQLREDIAEVLPYLNTWLENCDYYHGVRTLLWQEEGRKYSFSPREIVIAPVEDREKAQALADRIVGVVNDVWGRRHEIKPSLDGKRPPPNTLDVYRLLPRTNCKECGYATCMAFAAGLREGKTQMAQCPPLSEQSFAESRHGLHLLFE